MSTLTLHELISVRSEGLARLQEIRAMPGYGIALLRRYKAVLPRGVYDVELQRLREIEDRKLTPFPNAFAVQQLKRAYADDNILVQRRWDAAVRAAGSRNYLRAVGNRARSYRARGLNGMG